MLNYGMVRFLFALTVVLFFQQTHATQCQSLFSVKRKLWQADQVALRQIKNIRRAMDNKEFREAEFHKWASQLGKTQSQRPLTVMEHTALTVILKSELLKGLNQGELHAKLGQHLQKSWLDLTGQRINIAEKRLLQKLPNNVLAKSSRESIAFHQAAFHSSTAGKTGRLRYLRDYVFKKRDLAIATLGLIIYAFSKTGGEFLSGFLMGYAVITIAEHILHKYSGHMPLNLRKLAEKYPRLFKVLKDSWVGHSIIHHGMASENYQTTVLGDKRRTKWTQKAQKHGTLAANIIKSKFGGSLTYKGVAVGILVVMPAYAAVVTYLNFAPMTVLGFFSTSVLHVAASKWYHPHIHKSHTHAMEQAPNDFVRWLLSTRFSEMIARHHYIHHKNWDVNFNLVFGADWLFGTIKSPSLKELIQMHEQKLLGGYWEPQF